MLPHGSNGQPATEPAGHRSTAGAAPQGAGRQINIWGAGSAAVLIVCLGITAVAVWKWWSDPLARTLMGVFGFGAAAIGGAVAGIVLVPLGLMRERKTWWILGLVVGIASFAAMIAAIIWAVRADSMMRG